MQNGVEGIFFPAVLRAVLQVTVEDMTAIHAMTTVFALGKGFMKGRFIKGIGLHRALLSCYMIFSLLPNVWILTDNVVSACIMD